jgi:hypothetical protein
MNGEYLVIEGLPAWFLLPGGPRRRGGASRTHGRPSGEVNCWREDLAGVRASGLWENLRERKDAMDLGFFGGSGDLLIDVGGRRRWSWREEHWGHDIEQLSPIGRLKTTPPFLRVPLVRRIPKRYGLPGLVLGRFDGLRPGTLFSLFFSIWFFFFLSIFYLLIFIWIWFCFTGFHLFELCPIFYRLFNIMQLCIRQCLGALTHNYNVYIIWV